MKLTFKLSINLTRDKPEQLEEHHPRGDVYASIETVYQEEQHELQVGFQRNEMNK